MPPLSDRRVCNKVSTRFECPPCLTEESVTKSQLGLNAPLSDRRVCSKVSTRFEWHDRLKQEYGGLLDIFVIKFTVPK